MAILLVDPLHHCSVIFISNSPGVACAGHPPDFTSTRPEGIHTPTHTGFHHHLSFLLNRTTGSSWKLAIIKAMLAYKDIEQHEKAELRSVLCHVSLGGTLMAYHSRGDVTTAQQLQSSHKEIVNQISLHTTWEQAKQIQVLTNAQEAKKHLLPYAAWWQDPMAA